MQEQNEQLLSAWLRLSTTVNNNRLVPDMPYNESLICNILYRCRLEDPEKKITATDLCFETKMLKSQMNRTLTQLEAKNFITRERCSKDKRKIYIYLNSEQAQIYHEQHPKIIALLDVVTKQLGEERTNDAINIFNTISEMAEQLLYGTERNSEE